MHHAGRLTSLGLVAVVGAALAGCESDPVVPTAGYATFDAEGMTFAYPAAWRAFRHDVVSSFSWSIIDLGTVDVPNPCTKQIGAATEMRCGDRFRLLPNSLVVHVEGRAFAGWDIDASRPPAARGLLIGGRRAYVEETLPFDPAVGADLVITWTIDRPGAHGNVFTFRALLRGPDLQPIRDQLQELIGSIRFHAP